MEFNDVIQNRYSCKNYTDRQVDAVTLRKILEAGRVAPTAKNSQPQRIYVLQSEESLAIVDQLTPCRYGAPTVLAFAYDADQIFHYPGNRYDSGAEDVTIVATQIVLAAQNEGVNSCWLNKFDPDEAKELLQLPDNETVVLLLDLGYASETGVALPKHFDRKPLEETVEYR
ncbi:MAG: nitroreductase family protein [Erysipelotrichaceae bacterium]|nr:nitroreductase family protein [Erysipelotrichaceae bacterium]